MSRAAIIVVVAMGLASQYAPGVMEQVVENRQEWGQLPAILPRVDGYIAVVDCDALGEVWLLRPAGGLVWERFLVVDCAGPQLRPDGLTGGQWMERNGIIAEVGYPTAERWGTVGRGVMVERGKMRNGQMIDDQMVTPYAR